MKTCWIPFNPDTSGKYLATPGNHYAVLLSVDSRASMTDVTDELSKNELSVIYGWQSGQPTRKRFAIDRWLEMLPPPDDGTIWMYFELAYTGSMPRTLARHVEKCVLFVCGSVDIVYAFEAQQMPDNYEPCSPGETGGWTPGILPGVPPNATMDLVRCPDGSVHRAGQCPMSTGKKVAIGGAVVAAILGGIWWLHG
jgi:hypothetical protein